MAHGGNRNWSGAVLARGRYFPDASIPTCHVIKPREGCTLLKCFSFRLVSDFQSDISVISEWVNLKFNVAKVSIG